MTPAALLENLYSRGIKVRTVGGKLRVEARRGILTLEDREALTIHKAAILAALAAAVGENIDGDGFVEIRRDALDRRVIEAVRSGELDRLSSADAVTAIIAAGECISEARKIMASEEPVTDPGVWAERIKATVETMNLAAELRLRNERDLGKVLAAGIRQKVDTDSALC